MTERIVLYDIQDKGNIRFIGFTGTIRRFDLAIVITNHFFGKLLVLDTQGNRFAILGTDDLEEDGYLEEIYQLSETEANELREFLYELI